MLMNKPSVTRPRPIFSYIYMQVFIDVTPLSYCHFSGLTENGLKPMRVTGAVILSLAQVAVEVPELPFSSTVPFGPLTDLLQDDNDQHKS